MGVYVVPMPVLIEGNIYYEGVNLTQEQFYGAMLEGKNVSTTQPSPGDVMALWNQALEDHEAVVYIPMSSGLSTSCQAAIALAQEYGGRVQVAHLRPSAVRGAGRPGDGPGRRSGSGSAWSRRYFWGEPSAMIRWPSASAATSGRGPSAWLSAGGSRRRGRGMRLARS